MGELRAPGSRPPAPDQASKVSPVFSGHGDFIEHHQLALAIGPDGADDCCQPPWHFNCPVPCRRFWVSPGEQPSPGQSEGGGPDQGIPARRFLQALPSPACSRPWMNGRRRPTPRQCHAEGAQHPDQGAALSCPCRSPGETPAQSPCSTRLPLPPHAAACCTSLRRLPSAARLCSPRHPARVPVPPPGPSSAALGDLSPATAELWFSHGISTRGWAWLHSWPTQGHTRAWPGPQSTGLCWSHGWDPVVVGRGVNRHGVTHHPAPIGVRQAMLDRCARPGVA